MKKFCLSILILWLTFTSNAQQQETRQVGKFGSIKISGSMYVVLEQGDKEEVLLESNNMPLDKVITKVDKKGTLKIYKQSNSVYQSIKYGEDMVVSGRLKVKITYKNINSIVQSGSGIIIAESKLNSDEFSITENGSGRILIKNLEANEVDMTLSGSGKIEIQAGNIKQQTVKLSGSGRIEIQGGNIEQQTVKLSGSGKINLAEVNTQNVVAKVSGSGKIYLHISKNFEGYISGSGDIIYTGNPTNIVSKISGSGKIRQGKSK